MSGVDITGGLEALGSAQLLRRKQPQMDADGRRYGDGGRRGDGKANGSHHGEHGERRNLANGSDAKVKSIRCSPCLRVSVPPWCGVDVCHGGDT